jgi:hypothetical protein
MLKINTIISDDEIIIFNQKHKLGDLNQAILKRGEVVAVLDSSLFSLENFNNYLEFKGIVSYVSQKFLIVKLQNIPIIFKSNKIFDLNDEVSIYYPLEKIKAIEDIKKWINWKQKHPDFNSTYNRMTLKKRGK